MIRSESESLLEIKDLRVELMTPGGIVHAVQGATLSVRRGEVLGVVGESGSGKTMTVGSVIRLHDEKRTAYSGEILFENRDVLRFGPRETRGLRGKSIAMIFQDPMVSLNPIMRVGEQIAETVRAKEHASKAEARARALALLERVGVAPAEKRYRQYPFELSGGMMQRVMIAIALSCSPKLLIADEPTTALDVTIQSQILALIRTLQRRNNTAVLLVTHNFGVVAEICDRVAVMYAGRVVEEADVAEIFDEPLHPYTIAFLRSRPRAGVKEMFSIPGAPPMMTEVFEGCAYADRCAYAERRCVGSIPKARRVGETHSVCCFRVAETKARDGARSERAENGVAKRHEPQRKNRAMGDKRASRH